MVKAERCLPVLLTENAGRDLVHGFSANRMAWKNLCKERGTHEGNSFEETERIYELDSVG